MTAFALPLRAGRTPAAPAQTDPVWQNIDPASLPEDIQRHYFAYKAALDAANKARALFESEANEAFDVGATNRLAFGYKFGRLSVAIVPKTTPSAKGLTSISALAKLR